MSHTSTRWVRAEAACRLLGLSRHQLRQAINRGDLEAGKHWQPGPRPGSPRKYDVAALQQRLIELAGELRKDNGETFPPPRQEVFEGLAVDAEGDQIELHDGTGRLPATAPLGGLQGLTVVLDLLGEVQRQGRRAAGMGRPLSDAHAVAPSLGLSAGIDALGNIVFHLGERELAMPLSEALQLQAGLSSLLARELLQQVGERARLESLLSATPSPVEVPYGD